MENFYDYIEKGGIIFSILLVLSAIGLTLITYKFIEFNFFNDFDLQSFEEDLSKSKTLIKRINNDGTTILLTTHYLEEAEQLCNNPELRAPPPPPPPPPAIKMYPSSVTS